jgi:hypothetical protein
MVGLELPSSTVTLAISKEKLKRKGKKEAVSLYKKICRFQFL